MDYDTFHPPLAISLERLQVGHVLCEDLETRDGVLIAKAGSYVSKMMLQRVKNFAELSGIKEPIYVERY